MADTPASESAKPRQAFLGLTRARRYQIYAWSALGLLLAGVGWTWWYLRPERWYKYTDQVAFEQVARDVRPGYVLWEAAMPAGEGLGAGDDLRQPTISSDGARMVSGQALTVDGFTINPDP